MPENCWAFIHPFQLRLQRGIEVYLWNLASTLAQQGIQVEILTWAGPLEVPAYARIAGVTLRRVPAFRYFQAQFAILFYLYWLWRGHYQQVFVHFAGYGEGPALTVAKRLRSFPFSVVFHFPPSLVPHRYREFANWDFQRQAKNLIAVSQVTASEVQTWAARPCAVIEHGVDPQRFRPDAALREKARQGLGLGQDAPVLISVAALEERKGIQCVIRAIPKILEELPNTHYLIVGDGPYRRNLADLVRELALEERVHFLGIRLDVHPYLCAADLMLVLAQGEASSISLLEALACELPVVTSTVPPFDELIREDWGRRIDEKDPDQVASAIVELIKNPARRRALGEAGRNRVITRHAWVRIAEQYQALVS